MLVIICIGDIAEDIDYNYHFILYIRLIEELYTGIIYYDK